LKGYMRIRIYEVCANCVSLLFNPFSDFSVLVMISLHRLNAHPLSPDVCLALDSGGACKRLCSGALAIDCGRSSLSV
jgi:hypothetical protein